MGTRVGTRKGGGRSGTAQVDAKGGVRVSRQTGEPATDGRIARADRIGHVNDVGRLSEHSAVRQQQLHASLAIGEQQVRLWGDMANFSQCVAVGLPWIKSAQVFD